MHKVWPCGMIAAFATMVPFALAGSAERGATSHLCNYVRAMLDKPRPSGIDRLVVGAERKDDGYDHYGGLDIDRDGPEDVVRMSCGAGEPRPDPCILEVQLTTGLKFEVETWANFLISVRGRFYVVDAEAGVGRARGSGRVYWLSKNGARQTCAGL